MVSASWEVAHVRTYTLTHTHTHTHRLSLHSKTLCLGYDSLHKKRILAFLHVSGERKGKEEGKKER